MRNTDQLCDVAILVAPNYLQLTLDTLFEPLRMANTVSGRRLYTWRLCSDDRERVESGSGFALAIDHDIADVTHCDALFVVAGYEPPRFESRKVLAFLRRMVRGGSFIGGLDAGPCMLAAAGLPDGHRATTHWDDLYDFRGRHPRIDVVPERFVINRNRATTSGSLPSFDFVLEFIRRRHGMALAMSVSGNFL